MPHSLGALPMFLFGVPSRAEHGIVCRSGGAVMDGGSPLGASTKSGGQASLVMTHRLCMSSHCPSTHALKPAAPVLATRVQLATIKFILLSLFLSLLSLSSSFFSLVFSSCRAPTRGSVEPAISIEKLVAHHRLFFSSSHLSRSVSSNKTPYYR